ncbi:MULTISPECIES: RNA polymerase sigma factor [Paracoccus]|uniref:RNA polymerase sigma factor n=1 Tax=Paracoccus TaxID=265 RepID=UPI001FCA97B4|nr:MULTISPECIES: sigma-70 region 4 domain-containing protein [Paracoccus]
MTTLGARPPPCCSIFRGEPDKTRRIFVLHRIRGLSYREVAQHMALSESSVQKHLARALFEVTCRLREYEDGR